VISDCIFGFCSSFFSLETSKICENITNDIKSFHNIGQSVGNLIMISIGTNRHSPIRSTAPGKSPAQYAVGIVWCELHSQAIPI
jgi:hypothetical protein